MAKPLLPDDLWQMIEPLLPPERPKPYVERSIAWLHNFRRLIVRYERRADIHQAFLTLAAILICWTFI